jgi:DNA repair photolyase
MHNSFSSFYAKPSGGEGQRCLYPVRFDTYGCGCQHDCTYCYAKSLLSFRGLWHPDNPSVAEADYMMRKLKKVKRGDVLRRVISMR